MFQDNTKLTTTCVKTILKTLHVSILCLLLFSEFAYLVKDKLVNNVTIIDCLVSQRINYCIVIVQSEEWSSIQLCLVKTQHYGMY